MNKAARHLYDFGPFRLDTVEHLLLRGGEPVLLTPKVFDTLVVLVQRSGHLVNKEELMKEVWPDTIVEENNLDKSISALRRALGEVSSEHQYIETVRGLGYRFTASVRELPDESDVVVVEKHTRARIVAEEEETGALDPMGSQGSYPTGIMEQLSHGVDVVAQAQFQKLLPTASKRQRDLRWSLRLAFFGLLFALVIGLAAVLFHSRNSKENQKTEASTATKPFGLTSIAVLPFKAIGAESSSNEYIGIGMTDALITSLGNIRQIVVRPTSAVRRYSDPGQDPIAAGREQRVDTVLDGSVQKASDRIRVTVQLFRVVDGASLWSGKFDEKFADIFVVEDSISQQVTQQLLVRLSDEEKKQFQKRGTENVEAYQAYLKGRYFWDKRTAEGFKKAIDYFNQAIGIDPNYALAYSGLADSYMLLGGYTASPMAVIPLEKTAAKRALEIDEKLAEAHTSLALILINHDWDWAAAEREYKRAIELNPNYATAHHWYAEFLWESGRFDEGIAEIKRAMEIDPVSLIINTDAAKGLYFAGQYDQAIEQCRKTLEIDPNFIQAHHWLALAYAGKGQYEEAIADLEKLRLLDDLLWMTTDLGYLYAVSGKRDEAQRMLADLKGLARQRYVAPIDFVVVYMGLGEKDRAFEWLERAYEERSQDLLGLQFMPVYDSLRSDPRFDNLMRRVGLKA